MDLSTSMRLAAAGMKTQSARMRVVSENLANAKSTAETPGGEGYRRQVLTFGNRFDRALGAEMVEVTRRGVDQSPMDRRYEPSHPAADGEGYVLYPNVNPLIELMDMREAQRSFEANLSGMQQARSMLQRLIDVLR